MNSTLADMVDIDEVVQAQMKAQNEADAEDKLGDINKWLRKKDTHNVNTEDDENEIMKWLRRDKLVDAIRKDSRDVNIENEEDKSHRREKCFDIESDLAPWLRHTTGFASRQLEKKGYTGGGLGKDEDGIERPISIQKNRGREGIGLLNKNQPTINRDLNRLLSSTNQPCETNSMPAFDVPSEPTDTHLWPKNTVLIVGDSMMYGINEKRLSKQLNVKVRPHPGATTRDLYDHLKAHLRKKPDFVVLHVGANDACYKTKSAEMIFNEISRLKMFVECQVPGVKVTISCPIIRRDDDTANIKVIHLRQMLRLSGLDIITNDNITYDHLGKKGLHLTGKGVGRLAMNMIAFIKHL